MKRSSCTYSAPTLPNEVLRLPAYPKTGNEFCRQLKASLEKVECPPGTKLQQKEFGRLLGMPKSTTHDWYHGNLPVQIRYFFCALERLPESLHLSLIREFCRECPRLEHPRLAHDHQVVQSLKAILAQPTGLIFISGESDIAGTFLITALGHSANLLNPRKTVAGLDTHAPSWFVPVSGVHYLPQATTKMEAPLVLEHLLNVIAKSNRSLLLFNGIWNLLPAAHAIISRLARTRTVIVADRAPLVRWRTPKDLPTHWVSIATGLNDKLHVEIISEPKRR